MPSRDLVQSAVDQIIPQTLSRTKVEGQLDQAQAFEELREIILTLLVLDPNAILHFIRIARDKTQSAAATESQLATDLKAALDALDSGPVTSPIRSAATLGNAAAALTNLQSDISAGFVTPANVTSAKASIDEFLATQVAANVKSGGSEITTKDEAIRQIRDLLTPLAEAHTETLRLLFQLEKVFSEFVDRDLRVIVGNSIVEKSRNFIDRIRNLSEFAPEASADRSSEHLANLTAVTRLLSSYFEAPGPLDDRLVGDTTTGLKVKPIGIGTPAQLLSTTVIRPVATIETGASVFDVTGNGTPTSVDLLTEGISSTPATMFGSIAETYAIVGATNDVFDLTVDQGTLVSVTLTAGGARTAAQIASDINTAVGSTVAFSSTFEGKIVVELRSTTNGRDSHILVGSGTANDTLGFSSSNLNSGTDPTLDNIADALTGAQSEYVAAAVDASPATTTLVSTSTGVISNGILTDAGVADFLAAGVEGQDTIAFSSGPNDGLSLPVERVIASQVHIDGVEDDTTITYTIVRGNRNMRLTSTDTTVASALDVDTGNANTNLGFSGAETAVGAFPLVQIEKALPAPAVAVDAGLTSVVTGDSFAITGVGIFTVVALETLSGDPVVRVDPEVAAFTPPADFTITSFGATSFIAFIDEPPDPAKPLPVFISTELPQNGYNQDLRVLEDAVAQAINDSSKAAVAASLADDLVTLLDDSTGLQSILAVYTSSEVEAVTLILEAVEEHNLDRFLKLITEGFLDQALTITVDDASFTAQLQSSARSVNTEDLNVNEG